MLLITTPVYGCSGHVVTRQLPIDTSAAIVTGSGSVALAE